MITTENEFYIRFVLLLIEGGTDVLRVMLKHELEKEKGTFGNFLSSVKDKIQSAVHITKKQLELLYPVSKEPPDLHKCDISILAYLLNEFFTIKRSSESKAVNTIKAFRNDFFAHPKTASLDAKLFNSIWNKLSMAILTLSHDFTENERERFKEIIEHLSNDALDINSAVATLRTLDQTDEFNENINIRLTQLDQAVQYCHKDIELMKKQITELQKSFENQGMSTKVVNTVFGSLRLSALEQKTVDEAERVLLSVSKESHSHLESLQPHQAVRKAVDNLVQDMKDKGLEVEDVSKGSIVFTIKCQSFEGLIALIDYFDSPINNHLDAISRALSEVTGQKIEVHAMILTDRLSEELRRHERCSKTVKVAVKCSGLDSLKTALDVFGSGDAARNSFSGLQGALSQEVGKPINLQTAIDLEAMQIAIDNAKKKLEISHKYPRLVTFVMNICPKPMRELFISKAKKDKNIQYTNLKDYLVFREQEIRTLERRNKITTDQLDHIFPPSGIVDIQKWGVTLSSALLKGLFKTELDSDERFCLDTITTIRNTLQHIPSTNRIEDELFDSSWNDLKNVVLSLSKYAGAPDQRSIEDEISKALTENMPNLGDVLQKWYKGFTVQLSLQNKRLEKKLNEQASEIQNVRAASKKGKAILLKGTRKRQGRSGAAVKAFNIYDQKVDNMKEKFKRGFDKPFNGSEFYQDRIMLITKQLNENHRVIVTGNDNDLNYKCALAAIKGTYQCIDQCLETNNPSDWGLISFEDAKLVLFHEPFGRFKFDERKYEAMLDEIDGMLDATQGEDDDTIDVVIVANQKHLKEATDRSDHEMLCTSSVVEIDSNNINAKTLVVDDTIHRNLLDMAKTFKKSYIPKKVESQAKEKAKRLFIDQSMVVIVGPTGSGKTSLSFELLPLYDLSNGEDNFVVISDPSELKYVNLSLHPVIIIKSLCGVKFNHAEAHRWYSQLDRLYAAVKIHQIAVIITIESKVFQMIQSHMPPHHLLSHIVTLTSSTVNEREYGSKDTIDCEVQTDDMSLYTILEGNSTQAATTIGENDLRSLKGFREYQMSPLTLLPKRCRIISFSILPSGEILLIECSGKLLKLNKNYSLISTLQIDIGLLRSCVCYTGNDIAVILNQDQLLFVNIKEDMSLINSRSISHKCYSLACYSGKLYAIDKCSVYVYSTDGDFLKDLYEFKRTMLEFIDIAVRNDGNMIFIMTDAKKLITIDNFGNNLFMLDIPDIEGVFIGNQIRLCVGFHDNVFIFGEIQKGSNQKKIVQVHPGSRYCRVILQFESDVDIYAMQYDFDKCAVMLAGNSNMLTVLELR